MSLQERMLQIAHVAAEKYADSTYIRAAVQLIPYAGGPLDTLLAGGGAKLVAQRQLALIEGLRTQMGRLRAEIVDKDFIESEAFLHLLMKAFSHASRINREERIQVLARALASASVRGWGSDRSEDSEVLLDLAATLSIEDLQHLHSFVELGNRTNGLRSQKPTEVNELQGFTQAGGDELVKLVPPRVLLRLQARGMVREISGTFWDYSGGAYVPTILAYDLVEFLGAAGEDRGDTPSP